MASGKFSKGTGKPLGSVKITQIPAGQMFLLADVMKNLGNEVAKSRQGRIAQQLLAKMLQFPSLFSEEPSFC
jgi:hypothetical protein